MFSPEDLEKIRQAMIPLSSDKKNSDCRKKGNSKKESCKEECPQNPDGGSGICNIGNLTPQKILIIAGFLTGVLEVDSVLVDKDQGVEFVLTGSLKRPTMLDQVMGQIGQMPFEQVMQSIMNNIE